MKAYNKRKKPKHAKKIKVSDYDKAIKDMFWLVSAMKNFCNKIDGTDESKEIKITIEI